MNTSRNITELPLEVLGSIFDKLPSLSEKLCLAQVHPHIGLAFSCHYGHRFKNIKMSEHINLRVLLSLCGPRVEHIDADHMPEGRMIELVELHCPNLQSVIIHITENNINSVKSLLANIRSLREIIFVVGPSQKHWGIVKPLKFQANLRRLCLSSFRGIEILQVRNLVNLEELKIDGRPDNSLNIHELCHRLKKLRTLQIKCRFSAPNEFDGVPCPALKELHLHDSQWIPLKSGDPHITSILAWILSHAEGLEILTFAMDFWVYEPEVVIYRILSECKNLRSLCITMINKHELGTAFVHRVVKIVSENGVTSEDRPLDLNFCNPSIHHAIQEVMANTSAKQLITFKNFCENI